MTLQWINGSPEEISQATRVWLNQMESAITQKVRKVGSSAETRMQQDAKWRDQSGRARRGLRVVAREEKPTITLTFVHSVEYGKFLELAHGGKYAVVYPSMLDTIPLLRNELRGVANA